MIPFQTQFHDFPKKCLRPSPGLCLGPGPALGPGAGAGPGSFWGNHDFLFVLLGVSRVERDFKSHFEGIEAENSSLYATVPKSWILFSCMTLL